MNQVNRIDRRWLMALLAAVAAMSVACSTPAVPNDEYDSGSAWGAYTQCVAVSSNPASCNSVGSTSSGSYSAYTTGYTYSSMYAPTDAPYNTRYYKAERPGSGSDSGSDSNSDLEAQKKVAFHAYLDSLDSGTQAELRSQWLALAEQARVAMPTAHE